MNIDFTHLGLILDIIGAILLFLFGLPSIINTPDHITTERRLSKFEKIQNKAIAILAHLGIILLILGFILQYIGASTSDRP